MTTKELPNNIDKLKKMLIDKHYELLNKNQEIQQLKETILILQRKKFAPSSEKDTTELQIFNEVEDIADCEVDKQEETEEITYTRKKRGKRRPLPESLPRVDDIVDLPEDQKKGMKKIGEEITEKLEITPAKVWVRRIIRYKYASINSESGKNIQIASMPVQLLPKTMASASLIAYIITAKFVDSLPLYRQEKIFKRVMADISRQSMARWLISVSKQLIPVYNLLQDLLLESNYLQMDETTTQVLKEDGKKATSKSYMWVRHKPGDSPIILYDYAPTRAGFVPSELLEGFSGFLQTDGYDGYNPACKKYKLTRIGCWDHCRRKFNDASKTKSGKNIGKKGLIFIKKLYKIEDRISNLSIEEKNRKRQQESLPIANEFKIWIDNIRGKITPSSYGGKAINYTFNEWKYLSAYLNHGEINISNAWVENAIRPFCIGKKNWLFSASVEGAKASAIFYSLIETAKANGLEPFDYLNKLLDKLPHAKSLDDYERLLPLKDKFLA